MAQMGTKEIKCGKGKDAYSVFLEVSDRNIFKRVEKLPSVKGKKGEERIAAILAAAPLGTIFNAMRVKGGKINNGENGEPALEQFLNQTVISQVSYKDGKPVKRNPLQHL